MRPVIFEPSARRLRVMFNGETIADTTAARLLIETPVPVYYFPVGDVRTDLLVPGAPFEDPRKGRGRRWSIMVGDRVAHDAVLGFDHPAADLPELAGYLCFVWESVDHWFEEDEEIFRHARNPYKRVDALRSSRHVEVLLQGTTVADSRSAVFLFETGLPTRYYIPIEDVRCDLLRPSDRVTVCPYKGTARYYHLQLDATLYENVVWYYPDPIAQCPQIRGLLAFWNEFVDAIRIEGEAEPIPVTEFSHRPITTRPAA